MTIIERLKEKSEEASNNEKDKVKIELNLFKLALDLESKARNHLKRVITVLSEFDIHDEKHSEKVISNIELLMGDEVIKSLSSYELFLLHLSAFFHDCAMAPSDAELAVLELTEGTEELKSTGCTLANDLKKPLSYSEAVDLIKKHKEHTYKIFDGEISKWMFAPSSEKDFVEYLASMLIEYQQYRNGFADSIKQVQNQEDFEELNDFIRKDYIRATHHVRIETYVKNMENEFGQALAQVAWGKKLAIDLAVVCRSHGEDIEYLDKYQKPRQYYGNESANLPMVGMMLRLGDIIHFSFDRAPIELRTAKIFKSEFSFLQWALKSDGTDYSIENGQISFRAYCEEPEPYFKLHEYLDWIELEIQHYFKLERRWKKQYIPNLLEKIDRNNITHDDEIFHPQRGLGFSLNQRKIIELLMGVGLYKDPYACLREVYQNSLDACRCMLAEMKTLKHDVKGRIEFGIDYEDGGTYLYCLDNGIGMTKEIIEKYLLNIGNSFYKSPDFYKQQAQWEGSFTPTSQFGIGILSCFMLGDRLEITTKRRTEDYVSCIIDGPHEHFYYRPTPELEKEKIKESGTLLRIPLKNSFSEILISRNLEKHGLYEVGNRLGKRSRKIIDQYLSEEKEDIRNWSNQLYSKLAEFVDFIPDEIEVLVRADGNFEYIIKSKPYSGFDKSNCQIDFDEIYCELQSTSDLFMSFDDVSFYGFQVNTDTFHFSSILPLPNTKGDHDYRLTYLNFLVDTLYGQGGFSVDGLAVSVERRQFFGTVNRGLLHFKRLGFLSFVGEKKPGLSVDRLNLKIGDLDYSEDAKMLAIQMIEKTIELVRKHEEVYFKDVPYDRIGLWNFIHQYLRNFSGIIYNEFAIQGRCGYQISEINNFYGGSIDLSDFVTITEMKLKLTNWTLHSELILAKLTNSDVLEFLNGELTWRSSTNKAIQMGFFQADLASYWIGVDHWGPEYDFETGFLPLVPRSVRDKMMKDNSNEKGLINRTYLSEIRETGLEGFHEVSSVHVFPEAGIAVDRYHLRSKRKIWNYEGLSPFISLKRIREESDSSRMILYIYVSPAKLEGDEEKELKKLKSKDPVYFKGVKEGWSLLLTGQQIDNFIALPGKRKKEELVAKLSDEFWEEYKDMNFHFLDETPMVKPV